MPLIQYLVHEIECADIRFSVSRVIVNAWYHKADVETQAIAVANEGVIDKVLVICRALCW